MKWFKRKSYLKLTNRLLWDLLIVFPQKLKPSCWLYYFIIMYILLILKHRCFVKNGILVKDKRHCRLCLTVENDCKNIFLFWILITCLFIAVKKDQAFLSVTLLQFFRPKTGLWKSAIAFNVTWWIARELGGNVELLHD